MGIDFLLDLSIRDAIACIIGMFIGGGAGSGFVYKYYKTPKIFEDNIECPHLMGFRNDFKIIRRWEGRKVLNCDCPFYVSKKNKCISEFRECNPLLEILGAALLFK